MGPSAWYKVWATICLVLIEGGYNLEMKEGLQNSDNEEAKESETCAAAAADLFSDAKLEKLCGNSDLSEYTIWKPSESPHLWKKTAPPSKRRVEIHPKYDDKVTLSQIEKECEESMRKQLKENQHKKKPQFTFIGKINKTESSSWDQTESHRDKRCFTFLEDNERPCRAIDKRTVKSEPDLKGDAKTWIPSGEASSDKSTQTDNHVHKLSVDKNTETPMNAIGSNALGVSSLDPQKSNQEMRNDKALNPAGPRNSSNTESVELGELKRENKVVMKDMTDYEDRDLKLLKLLYEGLNSKDGGSANDVGSLVKTLKEIADKKMTLNMITRCNITAKPVSIKVEEKMKNNGQLKCANELFTKIKEYKDKNQDKKIIFHHFGSSPLNPNLINSSKEPVNPAMSNLFLTQPGREYPEILSFTKKNCPVLSSSLPSDQTDLSNITLLPNMNSVITEKSMGDYADFVRLIDKILGTISENDTETSELLHDLNRKLLGTSKKLGSYKMLEDLVREFGNSVAKIKGSRKTNDGSDDHIEASMRSAREVEKSRDKYTEHRARNDGKSNQTTQSSPSKPPNKKLSKADELKRLQKVATELKLKIDDLLQNLECTMSVAEEEEEEDDEDDDDDEAESESPIRDSKTTSLSNGAGTSPRRNKVGDDPFENLKKFKTRVDSKTDKRKFKAYQPKGRVNKIVGKNHITMSNRLDKSKNKYFKSKRDDRDDCEHVP